jgi:glycosyltransferase involved in cell wall biosynthesis
MADDAGPLWWKGVKRRFARAPTATRSTAITTPVKRTRRPRILYLSFFFPPSRASGVFRGRATANHLAQAGWDVTVLTAPREFFQRHLAAAVDETLEAMVDPRVVVKRPRIAFRHWERDVRRFGRLRGTFPTVTDKFYGLALTHIFPEHYLPWAPAVLSAATRMHARKPFDVILATGNPFVSFATAWMLGRTLRRPYVVDYRDAWTFNQFTEEVTFPDGSPARRWEARVLRDAAEIVYVNDGMRQWHAQRYPGAADRMTVVPNGWEPEIIARPAFRPAPPGRPLRFGYLGTVTPQLPLEELFEGWRQARHHPLLADAELDIHGHLGFFPHQVDLLRDRMPLHENVGVRYLGPFGKADAAKVYAEMDALVFCVPGARYVTTGKVFEYMASGKPIVSVHQPEIAAGEVLSGYPLWFAGDRLDADSVAASFVAAAKAARDLDRPTYAAALRHADGYTRDATLSPWEKRLRALVKESR